MAWIDAYLAFCSKLFLVVLVVSVVGHMVWWFFDAPSAYKTVKKGDRYQVDELTRHSLFGLPFWDSWNIAGWISEYDCGEYDFRTEEEAEKYIRKQTGKEPTKRKPHWYYLKT